MENIRKNVRRLIDFTIKALFKTSLRCEIKVWDLKLLYKLLHSMLLGSNLLIRPHLRLVNHVSEAIYDPTTNNQALLKIK